jgi:ABC-type sugar transport system ATPase subunit
MIHVENLTFSIGDFSLREFSLKVARKQYFVLLGPPGSGKSIFLECLCGLRPVSSGRIYIGGRDVTGLEPRFRGIGYVPQDYALFRHLTVEHNIAFGLRVRRCRDKQIQQRVNDITNMLGISHLLKRNITGLSGGEKQQVALSRTLVLEPKVLLLDEPVCALDEATRQQVCNQLSIVHNKLGLTTIHVSHNQEEAFSVADAAAVIRDGALQQTGSMIELFNKPKNEFVARFMRCGNLLEGEAAGFEEQRGLSIIRCGQSELMVEGQHRRRIKFIVRPENVVVLKRTGGFHREENRFAATLVNWRDCGTYLRLQLKGPFELTAHLSQASFSRLEATAGAELDIVLPRENIHVLAE